MNVSAQYDLAGLLERAGATPPRYGHGKWGCPRHDGSPSLSVDVARGLFNCHHAGCDFRGNALRLARQLGLARALNRSQYRELCESRERANRAARALFERIQTLRFRLLDRLRDLSWLQLTAHLAGEDHPATWQALALVYHRSSPILIELAVLENCRAAELIRFLAADREMRAEIMEGVLMRGGLYDSGGRFVDLTL